MAGDRRRRRIGLDAEGARELRFGPGEADRDEDEVGREGDLAARQELGRSAGSTRIASTAVVRPSLPAIAVTATAERRTPPSSSA